MRDDEAEEWWAEVDAEIAALCTPAFLEAKLHQILAKNGYRCERCWICRTLQPLILDWEGPRRWIPR